MTCLTGRPTLIFLKEGEVTGSKPEGTGSHLALERQTPKEAELRGGDRVLITPSETLNEALIKSNTPGLQLHTPIKFPF